MSAATHPKTSPPWGTLSLNSCSGTQGVCHMFPAQHRTGQLAEKRQQIMQVGVVSLSAPNSKKQPSRGGGGGGSGEIGAPEPGSHVCMSEQGSVLGGV